MAQPDPAPAPDDVEDLTAIRLLLTDCKQYLGGIYGILQTQQEQSAGLAELAPMVGNLLRSGGLGVLQGSDGG